MILDEIGHSGSRDPKRHNIRPGVILSELARKQRVTQSKARMGCHLACSSYGFHLVTRHDLAHQEWPQVNSLPQSHFRFRDLTWLPSWTFLWIVLYQHHELFAVHISVSGQNKDSGLIKMVGSYNCINHSQSTTGVVVLNMVDQFQRLIRP